MATLSAALHFQAPDGSRLLVSQPDTQPRPEGPDGSLLVRMLESVWSHFTLPARLKGTIPDEDAVFDYRSAPPKASLRLTVDLRVRGRGQPLPFALDDDLAE